MRREREHYDYNMADEKALQFTLFSYRSVRKLIYDKYMQLIDPTGALSTYSTTRKYFNILIKFVKYS